MFELPEIVTLARQVNETLTGKTIKNGSLGNTPHRFVWYNKSHAEFKKLTRGKAIGRAYAKGKWLFIILEDMSGFSTAKRLPNLVPSVGVRLREFSTLGGLATSVLAVKRRER